MSFPHWGTAGSQSHLVLIPSYNTGWRLLPTVIDALLQWPEIWVVIDGSTDRSADALADLFKTYPGLHVIQRQRNGGKGAAVFDGLRAAWDHKFTHALVLDADGQHPAWLIPEFMELSQRNPSAMVLGAPLFDASAPRIRVIWRRFSNFLARLETSRRLADSLFGFRVYPIADLLAEMQATKRMRRFDFDTEALVRLSWRGVPAITRPAPVRYFRPEDGGVSHFRYVRDNILLVGMHARLLGIFIRRLPQVITLQRRFLRHRAVD